MQGMIPRTPTLSSPTTTRDRLAEAIEQGAECFICEQSLSECCKDDLSLGLGPNQVTHKKCFNASHSLKRMLSTIADGMPQDAKQRMQTLKATDIARWRSICMALVTEQTHTRSSGQRAATKS